MSCSDCDQVQADNLKGKNLAYIRVGNGNVLIGACDKHFNMIRAGYMNQYESQQRQVTRMSKPEGDDGQTTKP